MHQFTDTELYQLRVMELWHAHEEAVWPTVKTLKQGIASLNAEHRAELAAACRGWRSKLNALPETPPAFYAKSHPRLLRYFGAVANIGDALAVAIEAGDTKRITAKLREFDRAVKAADTAWLRGHAAAEE